MATNAKIGYGLVLSYCTTSGGSYTALAEVLSVTPSKSTTEKIKVQSAGSATLYGDQVPGWMDASDFEAKVVYTAAQATVLSGFKNAQTYLYWHFVKPDGVTTMPFYGFISELGDNSPIKGIMENDIKIAISGPLTFNGS